MSARFAPISIAFWLIAVPASAELPGGGDSAFRDRMMRWEAPAESPAVAPAIVAALPVRMARVPASAPPRLPRLSSRFGYRTDPLHGGVRMHSGIDIPGPLGTPIRAAASGTVRFTGLAGGYGRMVEIAHGGGLTTRYAHLSRILVSPGLEVARGQTIALMGSTGHSTGSHLHFEVRSSGHATNPLSYFGAAPLGDFGSAPLGEAVYPQMRGTWAAAPAEPHISRFARARAAAGALDGLPSGERF